MESTRLRSMALGLCLLAVGAFARVARADTAVGPGELGGQVWMASAGPYHVQGTESGLLTVSAGKELRIEAGTTVQFSGPTMRLDVAGTIRILGTSAAPVTIQSEPGSGATWGGIWVQPNGVAEIRGAVVRDGGLCLWFLKANAAVERTTVENCTVAVTVEDGAVTLDSVILRNSRTGLDLQGGTLTEHPSATLTNALVQANQIRGVMVLGAALTASNCTFDKNGAAIDVYASGGGIDAKVDVQNSIFSNNYTGLNTETHLASTQGAITSTVTYSTWWGNTFNLRSRVGGNGTTPTTTTTLGPTELYPGAGNAVADPRFASTSDFHLMPDSSCVDSGIAARAPDHDLDGNPRPRGTGVDRGAYELGSAGGAGGAGAGGGLGGRGGATGVGGQGGGGSVATGGSGAAGGIGGAAGASGAGAGGASGAGQVGGQGSTARGGSGPDPGSGGMGGMLVGTGGSGVAGTGGAENPGAGGVGTGGRGTGAAPGGRGGGGAAHAGGGGGDGCGCAVGGDEHQGPTLLVIVVAFWSAVRSRRRRPTAEDLATYRR